MIKVYRPQILYNKYNDEEEKPVMVDSKTTENTHGGDEVTSSVNDIRYAAQQNDISESKQNEVQQQSSQSNDSNTQQTESEQQNQQQSNSQQQSATQQSNSQQQQSNNEKDSNKQSNSQQQNQSQSRSQQDNSGSQQDQQQNDSKSDEERDDESENTESNSQQSDIKASDTQQDNKKGIENENKQSDSQQDKDTQQHTSELQDQKQDNNKLNEEQNDSQQNSTNNNEEKGFDTQQNNQQLDESISTDTEEEDDYEDGEDYEEEEDDDQQNTYEYNTEEVVEIKETNNIIRQLYLKAYRLIDYLSDEEKNVTTITGENLVLNVKRLMLRQYERKPLNAYYYYRTRSHVILILDNSGSMNWLQVELQTFFKAALKRKDVEIYIAPNGGIVKKYDHKLKRMVYISHIDAVREIVKSNLPVIYFGDFDGANLPIRLSWTNKVYWICPETRYKYFTHHNWVMYDEKQFKGFFGRVFDDRELLKVFEEFAKNVYRQTFWYDKHDIEDFSEE